MKPMKRSLLVCIISVPLVIALSLSAKQTAAPTTTDEEANLRAYEILLRSDVNAKREPVVKEIMNLSESDDAKFEPIYREYEGERAKLDNSKAEFVSDYTKDYQTMSDDEADQLMKKAFEVDEQRTRLRKKYYDRIKKDLSSTTAARFVEVDSQLQDISDLQAASKLPTNQ
jgi:hypothetical protein